MTHAPIPSPRPADVDTLATQADRDGGTERRHLLYWRKTLQISFALLTCWLVVTLLIGFWVTDWTLQLFGWPVGYWAASQGALGIFCLIVWAYAWLMDRLGERFGERSGAGENSTSDGGPA